jgi:hypothetical protein
VCGAPRVDTRPSPRCEPQRPALPERFDGRRVGDRGADDPAGAAWRAQALGECARGLERDFLRAVDRLSVAGAAQGPAAEEHGARLSRTVELGRHVGAHSSRALLAVREQEGHEASPTAAIIDSQTAKGAQKGGLRSILQATTRARRPRVASDTSWSTRWASC